MGLQYFSTAIIIAYKESGITFSSISTQPNSNSKQVKIFLKCIENDKINIWWQFQGYSFWIKTKYKISLCL